MKISTFSDLPVPALIGAVVTSADGVELGTVVDVRVSFADHDFSLVLQQDGNGVNGIAWSDLADARFSLHRTLGRRLF